MPQAWSDYELMTIPHLLETRDKVFRYFQTVVNNRPNGPAKAEQLAKIQASLLQMTRVINRKLSAA